MSVDITSKRFSSTTTLRNDLVVKQFLTFCSTRRPRRIASYKMAHLNSEFLFRCVSNLYLDNARYLFAENVCLACAKSGTFDSHVYSR